MEILPRLIFINNLFLKEILRIDLNKKKIFNIKQLSFAKIIFLSLEMIITFIFLKLNKTQLNKTKLRKERRILVSVTFNIWETRLDVKEKSVKYGFGEWSGTKFFCFLNFEGCFETRFAKLNLF